MLLVQTLKIPRSGSIRNASQIDLATWSVAVAVKQTTISAWTSSANRATVSVGKSGMSFLLDQ